MRELMELVRQEINPHSVMWFYFGHDSSRDADESYTFFVVHGDKLISESCNFSWLEPRVLKRCDLDDEPIWRSHRYFDAALDIYWYRKFYTETLTGQLMVLRPDEPILYHYDRPHGRDALREQQFVTLLKTYRLLWSLRFLCWLRWYSRPSRTIWQSPLERWESVLWRYGGKLTR